MSRYVIPANTVVEVLHGDTWLPHTTRRDLEFDEFLSLGLHRYIFLFKGRDAEFRIRVETEKVKGDWLCKDS